MAGNELPTMEQLSDTKATLTPCPYCGLEMVAYRYVNFADRGEVYSVEHADPKAAQAAGCFEERDVFATLDEAVKAANMRNSEETRIVLRMVRDHYEHDQDAFEADCNDLMRHYDKTGRSALSEYVAAQLYPSCAFVPM